MPTTPDDDPALLHAGVLAALARRRVDEAAVLAREAVAAAPASALVWHAAAAVLARRRSWDDATACLERARELDPDPALTQVLDRLATEIAEGRRSRWGAGTRLWPRGGALRGDERPAGLPRGPGDPDVGPGHR